MIVPGLSSGSVQTKIEGMTCRVQENPEGRAGLVRMFGRSEIDRCRLGGIEVVNEHVEVHLLGPLLGRPRRRRVASYLMEGDARAVLGAHRSRVGGVVDLPIQQRAVEPGECTGVGTVDSEEGQASDSHAGHAIDCCGRNTSGFRSDVPALHRHHDPQTRDAGLAEGKAQLAQVEEEMVPMLPGG